MLCKELGLRFRGDERNSYFAVVPPSIGITVPVMKLPAGEASSSASPLISSGSPIRAIGIISANFFARSGSRRSRPPAMLV